MLEKFKSRYTPYDFGSSCSFYLGAIITALLCQGVAAVVAASLAKLYPDVATSGNFNTAFMIVFQAANAGFIIVFSYVRKRRFNFCYAVSEQTGKKPSVLDFAVPVVCAGVLMTAMFLPTTWYGMLTRVMGFPPDAGNIDLDTPAAVAMIVIAAVFLAPVFEETIYRGVLFNGLKSELSPVKAMALSALSFMLMHMSPLQVVFQFTLGLLSAYLAYRSGKLVPSILLHATANALALVMQVTPLAAVLSGCVEWLCANVTAAVFITLGLFAVGGAALFFGIDAVYGRKVISAIARRIKKSEKAQETPDGTEKAAEGETDDRKKALAVARVREGKFKYWIAIGICLLMFVINLIAYVLPQ